MSTDSVDHNAINDLLGQVGVVDAEKPATTPAITDAEKPAPITTIADDAVTTPVTAPVQQPQQGWLGWAADRVNPINWVSANPTKPAPVTPVVDTDETVDTDAINDLMGQLDVADETTPVQQPVTAIEDKPAVSTDSVDHNAINDLLGQVSAVEAEKPVITAPVADAVKAAPQQGLLGKAADLVSPGYWLGWNKPAPVKAAQTVDESLKDVSPTTPASALTQSVLSIAKGEPSSLNTKAITVSDEETVDFDQINDLLSTISDTKQIQAAPISAIDVAVDDDTVDFGGIDELISMISPSNSVTIPTPVESVSAAPLESANVNHQVIAELLAELDISSDSDDGEIDEDALDELMSGLIVGEEDTIHAADVLSDTPSLLDRLTDIGEKAASDETFGTPFVTTTMKAAQFNLRVATEKFELANANKLMKDADLLKAQARMGEADEALQEAKVHADTCRSVTNNGKLAAAMDFFTPAATNYQPAKLLAWAEGKKAAAHAYCEEKIAELSKLLFNDSKAHTLAEIEPELATAIISNEGLLKHRQAQFEPLKKAYEDIQSKAWIAKLASYPEGYKSALEAVNTEQQKLTALKDAQTEIQALKNAVGAWDQLVEAHGEVVQANQHYIGCQAAQTQAIQQVAIAKVPYESALAEVAKLEAPSHQNVDTHHAEGTGSAMNVAPKTVVLEDHHAAAHSDF